MQWSGQLTGIPPPSFGFAQDRSDSLPPGEGERYWDFEHLILFRVSDFGFRVLTFALSFFPLANGIAFLFSSPLMGEGRGEGEKKRGSANPSLATFCSCLIHQAAQ